MITLPKKIVASASDVQIPMELHWFNPKSLRFLFMSLTKGAVDPAGNVTVPATKSRKTAPEATPVISAPLEVPSSDPN